MTRYWQTIPPLSVRANRSPMQRWSLTIMSLCVVLLPATFASLSECSQLKMCRGFRLSVEGMVRSGFEFILGSVLDNLAS